MLGLIDLAFTGNLVLIVIFSGYENFVSRIEAGEHDRPDWMTKVDFGGLKQKLMTSIVAISAIQVLKAFMNIEQYDTTQARLAGRHPRVVPGLAADGRAGRPHLGAGPASLRNGARPRVEAGSKRFGIPIFLPAVPRCGATVRLC